MSVDSSAVITVQHHASAVYATVECLSVTSRCSTEMAKSGKQCHTIAQGLEFSDDKDLDKTQMGSPQQRRQMQVG